ncbi:peptide ABC transporter substrate-binding protein [Dysosmobacter sp. HCP28S3_G4]|uniref:peptide ABC transporter substrate-binding protein n=1 Tax=Dysosmobacter sp. HCP28S3_G4 TaxID=3438938 RepID=UPI003F88A257
MNIWKRAAAGLLSAVLCFGLLSGCGLEADETTMDLSVCLGQAPATLDPIYAAKSQDMTVISHLYENLMKIAADNSGGTIVTNGLAKSYSVEENKDGTVTYSFRLRSAKWSDGTAVTAQDFVYAWRRLANPVCKSPNAPLMSIVKGYDEVQSTGDTTYLAVEAKNNETFVVTLNSACDWFLTDVCTAPAAVPLREDVVQRLKANAIAANELAEADGGTGTATWYSDYTKLVTNGVYAVQSYNNDSLSLRKSSTYTGSIGGPDTITFRYAGTPEDAWAMYEAETVDFVSPLPETRLAELAQEETWSPRSELNTCALLFNTASDAFNDPAVRNAFSLVLDRIAVSAAAGVENTPATGLVPYGVPDTEDADFRTVGGELISCDSEEYDANCVQAAGLMETAGYGSGSHFPGVTLLYVAEEGRQAAVSAMVQMWRDVLGVTVIPQIVTSAELNSALASGEYTLAVQDIRGYVNDAESFLTPWESQSKRNVVGYYNSAFDTLLTIIGRATDESARRGCLHDAEVLLMEDCPLTPLFFTGMDYTLRDGYTGVCRDARGFFSFATVAKLQ